MVKREPKSVRFREEMIDDVEEYVEENPEHEDFSQFVRYCVETTLYYDLGFRRSW